ncbi:MAG: TetM/TetW/TetO/TetS family tetracycline resistance ribosomal protection protein [Clostridiales bacterium]|nr:TetM/TetW/TetO/TetS family tetracycline resistance ribosomal protection protein [Clostridiales bacterium]
MKKLTIGVLAHVDSGKTTLSEAMLYLSGSIKKLGRVDHGDAFLDTFALERERGITIFSKQAMLPLPQAEVTLLDTPGHVDFSAEMERTLQVLDYAILVISGTDGVQSHTETLWRLLQRYEVPTFLFVNKMDLAGTDREALTADLKRRLDENCVPFGGGQGAQRKYRLTVEGEALWEELALCDETLMEQYLDTGAMEDEAIAEAIARRQVYPCYFGAALKLEGVEALLDGLERYTLSPAYPAEFGAQVYKIARDSQGNRLTYLKVTGGSLPVKTALSGGTEEAPWTEKVDQIRIYSGAKYTTTPLAEAGTVCAVTGLTHTRPGQGLGAERDAALPLLEPVLTYQILLPTDCDPNAAYLKLKELEEEDPQLHILWDPRQRSLHIQLMGQVQLEVLKSMVASRFGLGVRFGPGSIVYKETIQAPVVGAGHFEPLRHYAEVHLLLEPGEPGSGLVFDSLCSEDVLDRNWQRLILTHLEEKTHLGVLTGSPITDMKITLLTGRAHEKHTEGGDFRQATYRAVRQGLMQAKSVLLEPWYAFRLELPQENLGRAMADIQLMAGSFDPPELEGDRAVLTGSAPVAAMGDYQTQVAAYTRGRGRLSCALQGYRPCHNQDEVVAQIGYDPEADVENTPDSVFCSHGVGTIVKWDQVKDHLHLDSGVSFENEADEEPNPVPSAPRQGGGITAGDKELQAIFERTYGPVKRRDFRPQREVNRPTGGGEKKRIPQWEKEPVQEFLLVDGYNIIFAWDELKALAKEDLSAARQSLIETLRNYQGCRGCGLILVFDAYRVPHNPGSVEKLDNIYVVYTKHAETADMYIEKVTYEIGRRYRVRVATSDALEQVIILGHGATRVSARMFREEVRQAEADLRRRIEEHNQS